MVWKVEDLDALKELETAVAEVWSKNPDMTDYVAGRAYESAFQYYRALNRGHHPKPSTLSGTDAQTLNALQATCEQLRTRGPAPLKGNSRASTAPVQLPKLVDYLRELHRSVERHTALEGRQGYLSFIKRFV